MVYSNAGTTRMDAQSFFDFFGLPQERLIQNVSMCS